jgi:RimJ/RimL family protein N-acetyltransferase
VTPRKGVLVDMSSRHIAHRVEWLGHPDVARGLLIDSGITIASTDAWLNRVGSDPSRRDYVFETSDGTPKAMLGLTGIEWPSRRGEAYIFVTPHQAGSGWGSAAMTAMLLRAFQGLDLNRVWLMTLGTNVRAQSFYERFGFRREGVMRQHLMWKGELEDRHIYGLLRHEWDAGDFLKASHK